MKLPIVLSLILISGCASFGGKGDESVDCNFNLSYISPTYLRLADKPVRPQFEGATNGDLEDWEHESAIAECNNYCKFYESVRQASSGQQIISNIPKFCLRLDLESRLSCHYPNEN